MIRKTKAWKKKQLEFKIWATSQLFQCGMTRIKLAEELGVPASRIYEAINGSGGCVKYIPMIISYFGGNEDDFIELFGELADKEDNR